MPFAPEPSTGRARFASAIAVVYWLALLVVMHIPLDRPIERLPRTFRHTDKIVHVAAYAMFAGVISWAAHERRKLRSAPTRRGLAQMAVAVCCGLAVYGALDELTQPLTGRDCNLSDFIGDMIGAVIGAGIYFALQRRGIATGANPEPSARER